jgi:hypothetical protein
MAHLEKLGYRAPVQTVRRYILEHYTAGHVNRKIGLFRGAEHHQALEERPWYTQTQAARVLRIRCGTVSDLVRRGVLQGQVLAVRERSIGVVSKDSVAALQRNLATGLGLTQTARTLGTGRHPVLDLIQAGLLPAVRTRKGWVILRATVQAVLDFCQNLPPLEQVQPHWLSLHQATRIYGASGLTLARALELAQQGQVAARIEGRSSDLRGLWLRRSDIEAQVPQLQLLRDRLHGYPLSRLGKILFPGHSCRETVLKKLIRAGFLQARQQGRRWVVSWAEVERFQHTFCLAREACTILQVNQSTLWRWEQSGQLQPVYSKRSFPGAGFSLYRRSDLQELRDTPRRRRRNRKDAGPLPQAV